jgi:hypothetical protein
MILDPVNLPYPLQAKQQNLPAANRPASSQHCLSKADKHLQIHQDQDGCFVSRMLICATSGRQATTADAKQYLQTLTDKHSLLPLHLTKSLPLRCRAT